MKKLLLIALLLIATNGMAQTTKPIDAFLGIKFGSTRQQVTGALKAKGAIISPGYKSNNDFVLFEGVKLGNRKSVAVFINFVNDQFYQAELVFEADLESRSIEYYESLVKDINDAYGPGKDLKKFKQPFTEGDGYEMTAIKSGNANYYTVWVDADNSISATITIDSKKNIFIRLYYTDGKLLKVKEEQQKIKNKSEF